MPASADVAQMCRCWKTTLDRCCRWRLRTISCFQVPTITPSRCAVTVGWWRQHSVLRVAVQDAVTEACVFEMGWGRSD